MKILNKWKCSIKGYPTEVKLSEKRRATYYKIGEAPPKKYGGVFFPDKEGYLLDDKGERIIKNSKSVGSPRMMSINGQKIYCGVPFAVRSKIVKSMHGIISEEFKKQLPKKIDIPQGCKILIHLHFHNTISRKLPDLDNMSSLWLKCGVDCLTEPSNIGQAKEGNLDHKLSIIKDDRLEFIQNIGIDFTAIKEGETSLLDFNIYLVEGDFNIENCLDKEL